MTIVFVCVAVVALLLLAGAAFTIWETARLDAAFPPTGGFVAVDGGRLHYTERRPSGTPRTVVLLLHGASGNQSDMMLPLGDRLAAQGFRVFAFDRPGYGWSDRPDGAADADPVRQAALIRAAMGRLGVPHAIVVGHSLGGATATSFALDQADFTTGLLLMSAVTHPWDGSLTWYNTPAASPIIGPLFTRTLTLPLGLLMLPSALGSVYDPQPVPPDYAAKTGVALILRPSSFQANAQDLDKLNASVARQVPRLPGLRLPVAIVTGDRDNVVSMALHSLSDAREIPGATLMVMPGIGHSPHWAEPDRIVAAIVALAARVGASPPS